eukprot:gb/GFBE01038803.1/.p1 GENE.gb/GFBE01038803.1/~~gb/GFBE01038803.1/.p1  ORF type:complete len:186 (+),score=42.44 gb/GFBE01038803.1/:1-558(+)
MPDTETPETTGDSVEPAAASADAGATEEVKEGEAAPAVAAEARPESSKTEDAEGSEKDKLAARAKRWGLPEQDEKKSGEDDKLAARAKRWGLPEREAETKVEEEELDSDTRSAKNDLESFLAKAAAKKGRPLPPPTRDSGRDSGRYGKRPRIEKKAASAIEAYVDPEEAERRKRRAERFAPMKKD